MGKGQAKPTPAMQPAATLGRALEKTKVSFQKVRDQSDKQKGRTKTYLSGMSRKQTPNTNIHILYTLYVFIAFLASSLLFGVLLLRLHCFLAALQPTRRLKLPKERCQKQREASGGVRRAVNGYGKRHQTKNGYGQTPACCNFM